MSKHSRTIVGGRSSGSDRRINHPRAIEILLKKAKVDPEFRELLLRDPVVAAGSIELELTENERLILTSASPAVLTTMIQNSFVPRHQVRSFLTQKAPALLLLVLASTAVLEASGSGTKGITTEARPAESLTAEVTDKMAAVQSALEHYRSDHGVYPSTDECRLR